MSTPMDIFDLIDSDADATPTSKLARYRLQVKIVVRDLINTQSELAALKAELARKDELIDDLRAMHGVPSDADLARARDDEARECAAICHDYAFDQRRSPLATGGAFACKAAIERRISERAK